MSGRPDVLAPDLILVNGSIHTVDDANPSATAVAIRNGRFIAVGDDEIRDLAGPSTRVEDLDGATVVPELIDAHNHLQATGRDLGKETEALTPAEALRSYTLGGAYATIARTGRDRLFQASWPTWSSSTAIRWPRLPTSSNTCARSRPR
jgi:predicted amidohydrolase YtcJ